MPRNGNKSNVYQLILQDLKKRDHESLSARLKNIEKSDWPVELLIPFILQSILRRRDWDLESVRYIVKSFHLFSQLRCLSLVDRCFCLEIYRLAIFVEAVTLISNFSSPSEDDRLRLSDDVMRLLRLLLDKRNTEKRYVRQLTYLEAVCERRERLKKFNAKSSRYLRNLITKLKGKAIPLIRRFIKDM